jgi:hypothetical protein
MRRALAKLSVAYVIFDEVQSMYLDRSFRPLTRTAVIEALLPNVSICLMSGSIHKAHREHIGVSLGLYGGYISYGADELVRVCVR